MVIVEALVVTASHGLAKVLYSVKEDYHFRRKTSDTIAKSNFGFYTKSIKCDFGAYYLFICAQKNHQTQPNQNNKTSNLSLF